MAAIAASVPVLAKRTFSALGTVRWISSATSTSIAVAAANSVPSAAASRIASTTRGCACPNGSAPYAIIQSMYSLPSTS